MRRAAALALAVLAGCEEPPTQAIPPDAATTSDLSWRRADLAGRGAGILRVIVVDGATGRPQPARVVISAIAPTPDPMLDVDDAGRPLFGERSRALAPGVLAVPEGVILAAGDGAWTMPAGDYRLELNRGPGWEERIETVSVVDGATATVSGELAPAFDHPEWVAADLHLHTGRSFDSALPASDRVASAVAAGIALVAATDHDVVTDLEPALAGLGYGEAAAAVPGVEIDFAEGHAGAFPIAYDPADPFGGAVGLGLDLPAMRPLHSAQAFDRLHGLASRPVVIVEHPEWPGGTTGWLSNLGWAPPEPLDDAARIDGLELLNGFLDGPEWIEPVVRDWFFLLDSGYRPAAIGSSDSHRLRDVKAGFPRTWLRLAGGGATVGDQAADAVRARRAIVSNGPFALLTVDGAGPGDQVTDASGDPTVEILVEAPSWIAVDRVTLFVNGQAVEDFPVAPGLSPRAHYRFGQPLPPGDAWIALAVSAAEPIPSVLAGEHVAEVLPFAITNPVFVDGDGDGRWLPRVPERDPGPLHLF